MKLWGRKRRLDVDEQPVRVAVDKSPANLQREISANQKADTGLSNGVFPVSPAWESLSPTSLALKTISPIVDAHWDRSLSAWRDPTTTLSPLSHYKSHLAPSGEVSSIATIKEPFSPSFASDMSGGNFAVGDIANMDVARRQASTGRRSYAGETSPMLQRIAFSDSNKHRGSSSVAKSPFPGRKVVGVSAVTDSVTIGNSEPIESAVSQTGKLSPADPTSPVKAGPNRTPNTGELPVLQLARPKQTLTKAPTENKIFRSIKPVQRLRAGVSKFTDSGLVAKSETLSVTSPSNPKPEPISSDEFPLKAADTSRPVEENFSQPGLSKEIAAADITTVPLIGQKESGSIPSSDNLESGKISEQNPSTPGNLQRESMPERPVAPSLKIGSPIKETPDSAISFSNLGATSPAETLPFQIKQPPPLQVAGKSELPELPVSKGISTKPPLMRQIPRLGPVPLQRLDLSVAKGSFAKDTSSSTKIDPIQSSEIKDKTLSTGRSDASASWDGDPKLRTGSVEPLLGYKKTLLNITNDEKSEQKPAVGQDGVAKVQPRTPINGERDLQGLFVRQNVAAMSSGEVPSAAVQRMAIDNKESQRENSYYNLPMVSDNPLLQNLSNAPETTTPASKIYPGRVNNSSLSINLDIKSPQGTSKEQTLTNFSPLQREFLPRSSVSVPRWRSAIDAQPAMHVQRVVRSSPLPSTTNSTVLPYRAAGSFGNLIQTPSSLSGLHSNTVSSSPGTVSLLLQREPAKGMALPLANRLPERSYRSSTASIQRETENQRSSSSNAAPYVQRVKFPSLSNLGSSVTKFLGGQFFGSSTTDSDSTGQSGDTSDKPSSTTTQTSSNPISDLSQDDLRRLAARVYPHISQKIKAEIERDRERSGMITGLHR